MSTIADIYSRIGSVGVILLIVAVFALYIALWQLFYMHMVWRNFKRDFLDIEKGDERCLRHIDPEKTNPLIRIIYEIVTTHAAHSDDIRAEVGYLFYRNFKAVTNGLYWLRLISIISPLLGLLGTVCGMTEVFRSLSEINQANAAVLASGIWSALMTTIIGLSIAIPVLMVYYYLTLRFRGFHIEAIEHSYRALEVVRNVRIHPVATGD